MKFLLLLALTFSLIIGGQPAQAANMLTNGSFEDTTGFVPNAQDTMSLLPGSTTINGWSVVTAELAWIGPTNPWGLSASYGSYFLDFTGYHNSFPFAGVQQAINTVPGQSYILEFDLGSSTTYGLPVAITAAADSTSQTFTSTNTSSSNAWDHFVLPFTANTVTTLIALTGSQGYQHIGLDNVSVTAAPLPPSAWLLASGLLGLMGWRRWGKK